jgi:hypothetical protein
MVDVPESQGLDTSEDRTRLEAALRNSSLDVCKDVLPRRGSSDDDDDEDGGQDRREGGKTGDHACVTVVNSTGALDNPLSNSRGVSGHSGDEPVANKGAFAHYGGSKLSSLKVLFKAIFHPFQVHLLLVW